MTEIPTPLIDQQHPETKAVPALHMFQSAGSVEAKILEAFDRGDITIVPTTDITDDHVNVGVDKSELQLRNGETHFPPKLTRSDLGELTAPETYEKARAQEAERIKQRVLFNVSDEAWWLNDENIQAERKDGMVTQVESLKIGDITIPFVNFTETIIPKSLIERLALAIQQAGHATHGQAERILKAICVQDQDKFSHDQILGTARVSSGIIRLSANLFNGVPDQGISENKAAHVNLPAEHYAEITLLHEIGHLVQGNAKSEKGYDINNKGRRYSDLTGWEERSVDITDDYGEVVKTEHSRRGLPGFRTFVKDYKGDYDEVATTDIASMTEILDSAPVTEYGATNIREDFAEAFPIFVLAPDTLEPVRRHAIQYLVDHPNKTGDTGDVQVEPVDIKSQYFAVDTATPRSIKLNVSFFPMDGTLEVHPKTLQHTWVKIDKKIVDDYGNETTGYTRHGTGHYQ